MADKIDRVNIIDSAGQTIKEAIPFSVSWSDVTIQATQTPATKLDGYMVGVPRFSTTGSIKDEF